MGKPVAPLEPPPVPQETLVSGSGLVFRTNGQRWPFRGIWGVPPWNKGVCGVLSALSTLPTGTCHLVTMWTDMGHHTGLPHTCQGMGPGQLDRLGPGTSAETGWLGWTLPPAEGTCLLGATPLPVHGAGSMDRWDTPDKGRQG